MLINKIDYKLIYIFLGIIIIAILGHYIKQKHQISENIENFESIIVHDNYNKIYDKFYAEIYNELFNSIMKNEYEIQNIKTYSLDLYSKNNKEKIHILDAGCGIGNHLKILDKKQYKCTGLDNSQNMLKEAKKLNPGLDLIKGDFHNKLIFKKKSFSHILCLFFTIYYSDNPEKVFKNFNYWLKPKGYLVLHLVHPKKFDPVLEKASSLIPLFNPQKHSHKRVTQTELHFNKFKYNSDWLFNKENVTFTENIKLKDNSKVIKNTHKFTIYKISKYIKLLQNCGFKLTKIIDLTVTNHEFNNLYIFKKIYGY